MYTICTKRQANERENKKQAPSLELNQTKPVMDIEWSFMYTLIHLKKIATKEDLIAFCC